MCLKALGKGFPIFLGKTGSRAFKSYFLSLKKTIKKQTSSAWIFLQPPMQVCRSAYIPNFKINAPIFCCPLFFKEYLNPQVRINKMINEHNVDYHPNPLELTSRIHFYSRETVPKDLNMKYRSKFNHGFTNSGYLHCDILKALYDIKEKRAPKARDMQFSCWSFFFIKLQALRFSRFWNI